MLVEQVDLVGPQTPEAPFHGPLDVVRLAVEPAEMLARIGIDVRARSG